MNADFPKTVVPNSFGGYLHSMSLGIVIALTWLGVDDLVGSVIYGEIMDTLSYGRVFPQS